MNKNTLTNSCDSGNLQQANNPQLNLLKKQMLLPVFITELLPLLCIAAALGLLGVLTRIDLREFLLPDKYVFPFGALGVIFHAAQGFTLLSPEEILMGGIFGAGILLLVRFFGNKYYGQETLGLGDVKLMGAAGLWLGLDGGSFALTLGAAAGLFHGLGLATIRALKGQGFHVRRMVIPAGPGFIVGIIATGGYLYGTFILSTLTHLIP